MQFLKKETWFNLVEIVFSTILPPKLSVHMCCKGGGKLSIQVSYKV